MKKTWFKRIYCWRHRVPIFFYLWIKEEKSKTAKGTKLTAINRTLNDKLCTDAQLLGLSNEIQCTYVCTVIDKFRLTTSILILSETLCCLKYLYFCYIFLKYYYKFSKHLAKQIIRRIIIICTMKFHVVTKISKMYVNTLEKYRKLVVAIQLKYKSRKSQTDQFHFFFFNSLMTLYWLDMFHYT